ncbi:MAG: TIGR01459 family HAD-type hydrolase [Sulfitobacter sp.]
MHSIDSIQSVAADYDTLVFDQWGVLHNGSAPYPDSVETIRALRASGGNMAVLSNSGKAADVNAARITDMGFDADAFDVVMTSGEALYRDFAGGALAAFTRIFAITGAKGDAARWARGLPITFVDDVALADAVLLMGLPEDQDHSAAKAALARALELAKPLLCSNPDRASPRADGVTVQSPGALAHDYKDAGGDVTFYGKPHYPIFAATFDLIKATEPGRVLMIGDSPEHDIAGAQTAGWDSLFIHGGLHAGHEHDLFQGTALPTYSLPHLR